MLSPGGRRALRLLPSLALVAGSLSVAALSHALLPGRIPSLPAAYIHSGIITCLSSTGFFQAPLCESVGLPIGFLPLTEVPFYKLAVLLRRLGVLDPLLAARMITGVFVLVSYVTFYLLARRLGVARPLGLIGAFCYLNLPIVVGHSGTYSYYTGMLLLPSYLLLDLAVALRLTGDRPAPRHLFPLVGLAYAAARIFALFQDPYTFVFWTAVSGVACGFTVWRLLAGGRRLRAAAVLSTWLASTALAGTLYQAYVPGGADYTVMPAGFFRAQGVDVVSLVVPSHTLWWAKLLRVGEERWNAAAFYGDGTNVSFNYLGVTLLVSALFALREALKRRSCPPSWPSLLVAGGLCFAVSLGPSVKIGDAREPGPRGRVAFGDYLMPAGRATIDLPLEGVFVGVPGLRHTRAVYRWIVVPQLVLLLLCLRVATGVFARHRPLALSIVLLAAVEHLPDVGRIDRDAQAKSRRFVTFRDDVVGDLESVVQPGERILFLSTENDFLANYLVPVVGAESFNVGGDKNLALSLAAWPREIRDLRHRLGRPGPVTDGVEKALASGLVDAVVAPYLNLRWDAYGWPPGEGEREAAREAHLDRVGLGSPGLRFEESRWFGVYRMDSPRRLR